jgi:ParB family chromosome partitioning protein
LLLEFFNDPEQRLRDEAFEFATKKNKELPPLEAALKSRYVDLRKKAVEALIQKRTKAALGALVSALADPDKDVRLRALGAVVAADARDVLLQALAGPHADVRARAACALAAHGSPEALPALLELATAPKPAEKEREGDRSPSQRSRRCSTTRTPGCGPRPRRRSPAWPAPTGSTPTGRRSSIPTRR